MPLQERWLPLFPLNLVLFPDMTIPLNIFEERYKLMINSCLENDSKFGVVLIKAGQEVGSPAITYSTGTVAYIDQTNHIEHGQMLLSVIGEQRFRIKHITQYEPYTAGQVEVLTDDEENQDTYKDITKVQQAITQHLRLMLGLSGGWVRDATIPSGQVNLSYFIPKTLQGELHEMQSLLEEDSSYKRLDMRMDLLEQYAEKLKKARNIRRYPGWEFGHHYQTLR